MFRKHPTTDAFDLKRIEQHIAAIQFLSNALLMSTQKYQLSSYLSVMMNAIKSFEKHRFSDYQLNETKRAEQVLHTRKIFNALYKNHLKKSDSSILAHALKHELRDYATSVEDFVDEVQNDLADSIIHKYEIAEDEMKWALMESSLRQAETEYQANRLSQLAEEAGVTPVAASEEDDMDYLIFNVSDEEISDEELSEKPYMRGTMPSDSDEEYLSQIDSDASDSDDDYQPESASCSYSSTSPSLSQLRLRNEWLRNSWSDASSDSDEDYVPDYSPRYC